MALKMVKPLPEQKIAHVLMDEKKFDQLFQVSENSSWKFEPCSIEMAQKMEKSTGHNPTFLVDAAISSSEFEKFLKESPSQKIAIFDHDDVSKMIYLLSENHTINHLLCVSGERSQERLEIMLNQIENSSQFGISRYPNLRDRVNETIQNSRQKSELMKSIAKFTEKMGRFEDFSGTVTTIAWELVSNAIFDAPIDPKTGERKYNTLDRDIDLALQDSETVDFSYGVDDNFLILSVKDQFGSIDRATIVDNLYRCNQKGDDQIRRTPGGAGFGLFLVLNLATQLDIYVKPDTSTEVVCLINTSKRLKEYEERGVAINLFIEE